MQDNLQRITYFYLRSIKKTNFVDLNQKYLVAVALNSIKADNSGRLGRVT